MDGMHIDVIDRMDQGDNNKLNVAIAHIELKDRWIIFGDAKFVSADSMPKFTG